MTPVHTVLMGDPAYFSVLGGANPHTRDRWGRKKSVNIELAIRQWRGLRALLINHGLNVVVISPDATRPGLVYPANAGVRFGRDFILSNLTPTRAAEAETYRRMVSGLGFACRRISQRFEGEADFFPAGSVLLYTYGDIRAQRFVPHWGWPPWRRIYGFRSDPAALEEIAAFNVLDRPVVKIRLRDERYYHGDTCLCSFGPGRCFLLAWLPALDPRDADALRGRFGTNLCPLSEADAALYAANSFAFSSGSEQFLVMPRGISEKLIAWIRQRRVRILFADVSEFLRKGGGSVKCMIGDLGLMEPGMFS